MATSLLHSLPSVLRTVFRRVVLVLETPLMYLFGRDIFISYARADAATYAQHLAIAVRGEVPKLSFFLDQWASLSGTTLPLSLRLALRWSQLLVFVGTQNAIDSAHVRMELRAFFNRKGRFVPIDVGGVLGQAIGKDEFLSAVCGPGAVHETSENVASGTPSKIVVTRVVNAVTFTRQDRRLRRAVVGTTIGIVAIIATAFFASRSIISNAQAEAREATQRAREADRLAGIANDDRQRALKDLNAAQIATDQAKAEKALAENLTKEATEEAELAKVMRIGAERLRDQARTEASRQSEISLMRRRANQSELMLQRNPTRLADSVSLAIESMKRALSAGVSSLEADRALRGSLSLLPRSLGPATMIDGVINMTALSPDGKQVAVLSRAGSGDSASLLQIVTGSESRSIGTYPREWRYIALSSDSRRVAIGGGPAVQIREISGEGKWNVKIPEDDYVSGLALSPNGKYVAVLSRYPEMETRGFASVFEVESGKSVGPLPTGTLDMKSVAFSADGRLLAIGGGAPGPRGRKVGHARVWNLGDHLIEGRLNKDHFDRWDELFQNDEIQAIAAGRDDRFLATASGQLAVVWKKNAGGYYEIARMSVERRIDEVAFTADGKNLNVLSGGTCQESTVECRRRFLETWESMGYSEAVMAPHTDMIGSMSFRPGDDFVTTITEAYSDNNVRVVRTTDGVEMKNPNVRFEGGVRKSNSPDTRYVVVEREGAWHVSDTVSGAKIPVKITGVKKDHLENPALSRDGSLLVFGGKKAGESGFSVFIYTPRDTSYEIARSFPVAAYPTTLAISSDKKHVAVSHGIGSDAKLKVFDAQDWHDRTPAGIAALTNIDSFEFAPDGKTVAVMLSRAARVSVGVWRLHDGRQVGVLQGRERIRAYSFNWASDRLAVAMKQDAVELMDLHTGRMTALPTNRPIELLAFSPNGKLLATADEQGLVTLVDLSSLDEIANLPHENKVSQIAFSQDGKYLATASNADDEDPTPPDERHLLHVWLLRPEDLIKEACQRLTRFRETPLPYCAVR